MKNSLSTLSYFFSILIMFTSCSKYDAIDETNNSSTLNLVSETTMLENFVIENIAITNELASIFNSNENINLDLFITNLEKVTTNEGFKNLLIETNFSSPDKIITLINNLNDNVNTFKNNSPEFFNMTEEEKISLFTDETIYQLGFNEENQIESCQGAYTDAQNACLTAYGISMGIAAITGAISFGITTVIGIGGASAAFVLCMETAQSNYYNCQL